MSEANESSTVVHIHVFFMYVRVFGGTLLPVIDLRQKRHHVRNIPDGIQLIRNNLHLEGMGRFSDLPFTLRLTTQMPSANQPTF